MWSKRFKPKIKRAAEFNTDCSCWTRDQGPTRKNTITVIQSTINQLCMHQEKFWFNRQGLPSSTDQPNMEITVLANAQDMLGYSYAAIKDYPWVSNWSNATAINLGINVSVSCSLLCRFENYSSQILSYLRFTAKLTVRGRSTIT